MNNFDTPCCLLIFFFPKSQAKKLLPYFNLLDKFIVNLPFNLILEILTFVLNVGENLHRGL